MMENNVLEIIASETEGKSHKAYKYSIENDQYTPIDYDDHAKITWKAIGETAYHDGPISVFDKAEKWKNKRPLFTYFLDGSRRVYKVDDIAYSNKVYPIMAGQIGISCCQRVNRRMKKHSFERRLVIALPEIACGDDWGKKNFFERLKDKINENDLRLKRHHIEFTDILDYTTTVDTAGMDKKGIAVIQDLMVKKEIEAVNKLVSSGVVDYDNYLMKDGSLEYKVDHFKSETERSNFQMMFHYVVGVSKSFNPENCIDKRGHNNSDIIADLVPGERTPVFLYQTKILPGMSYAIWYLRIRSSKCTTNAFDGILKIEKILPNSDVDSKLDSDEVDLISANIINERNPTCYGVDHRWANHLYPIFVTESYAKSQYMSNTMFLNLF